MIVLLSFKRVKQEPDVFKTKEAWRVSLEIYTVIFVFVLWKRDELYLLVGETQKMKHMHFQL